MVDWENEPDWNRMEILQVVAKAADCVEAVQDLCSSEQDAKCVRKAIHMAKQLVSDNAESFPATDQLHKTWTELGEACTRAHKDENAFSATYSAKALCYCVDEARTCLALERAHIQARRNGVPYNPSPSFRDGAITWARLAFERAKRAQSSE